MIHINFRPEPDNFDREVRQPGLRFLSSVSFPTTQDFKSHSYWRSILSTLHESYGGICAFSCHWIPYDTGADTVEHFRPKSIYPNEAYEWSNYRLVCSTLNGRKGNREDILDPFRIQNGWFILNFPSLLVRPSQDLDPSMTQQVQRTINQLGLNDEGTCLKSRVRYIDLYCQYLNSNCINGVPFSFLRQEAPFIAMELERQELVESIKDMMCTS